MNLGRCGECGASVIWSTTIAGRKLPLNPIPIQIAMGDLSDEDQPVAVRKAYAIHFTTCAKRDTRIRR